MTCYDWDPDNFEVDDAEVVFAANAVATWPESRARRGSPFRRLGARRGAAVRPRLVRL